jgi:exopolysaccharide biosynthesis WecB/TagA/CpsF family protein
MKLPAESLFGINISAFESIDSLSSFVIHNPGIYISVNAESLYNQNPIFSRLVNTNYGYADGVGAVISSRINGSGSLVKLPGCELWLSILSKVSATKVAFIGGDEDTINKLTSKIKIDFPLLDVVYFKNGFFEFEEQVLSALKECEPEFVFVGMGQPKQELFCEKVHDILPQAKLLPIGGSFDLYVGKVSRAPVWMVRFGLEWLYRLIQEPSRWRRQLVLPKFLIKCISFKVFH